MGDVVKAPSTTFVSRPREDERTTRSPLHWWDRTKILLFLAALFFFFVWMETSNNPLMPVSEAFRTTFRLKWWLPALFGIELLRQLHFVLAEHWSAYYFWWKRRFENNDLCNHSVMAASTLPANQFNIVAAPNQPYEHLFEPQKHPVQVGCALHPWMRALVVVK